MAKMIQVRNVPDRLHRELVQRARSRGQTLTEFIEQILQREVARPSREEVFERIATRTRVDIPQSAAELIGEARRQAR